MLHCSLFLVLLVIFAIDPRSLVGETVVCSSNSSRDLGKITTEKPLCSAHDCATRDGRPTRSIAISKYCGQSFPTSLRTHVFSGGAWSSSDSPPKAFSISCLRNLDPPNPPTSAIYCEDFLSEPFWVHGFR